VQAGCLGFQKLRCFEIRHLIEIMHPVYYQKSLGMMAGDGNQTIPFEEDEQAVSSGDGEGHFQRRFPHKPLDLIFVKAATRAAECGKARAVAFEDWPKDDSLRLAWLCHPRRRGASGIAVGSCANSRVSQA
jgi:hypothetical protein